MSEHKPRRDPASSDPPTEEERLEHVHRLFGPGVPKTPDPPGKDEKPFWTQLSQHSIHQRRMGKPGRHGTPVHLPVRFIVTGVAVVLVIAMAMVYVVSKS